MKVLFLDFDGVINSTQFLKEVDPDSFADHISEDMVAKINRIIEETDAKVVISSSWRHTNTVEELRELLEENGFEGEVLDKIEPNVHLGEKRGTLIINWVSRNDCDEYVAIDDKENLEPMSPDKHVQTNYHYGVTDEDAEKAIDKLS